MRAAIAMSAALHAAIFALAILGLPVLFESRELVDAPIMVDLVEVAEVTTPQPLPEPEPVKEEVKTAEVVEPEPPKPEPPKAPPPPPEPPPPPPPEPEPIKAPPPPPPPEPEPVKLPPPPPPPPPPPEPEPVKAPPPEPEPEQEKKVALAVPEPAPAPKPKPKPKPPPKPTVKQVKPVAMAKRKTEDFIADITAALLDKKIKEKPRQRLRSEPEAKKVAVPPTPRRLSTLPLTMSEKDAIRAQIERCWSVPAGARDAENLQVKIRIYLNPDGSLSRQPEIIDSARMDRPGEEYYRSAAESARRAVLNPRCSPLQNLPISKYERWREIELTFDPKEMLGG